MADIKVTDKRMFTPDGQLREEFAADQGGAERSEEQPAAQREEPARAAAPPSAPPESPASSVPPPSDAPRLELPGAPPGMGPSFYDLVAVLAEPISIYLGDLPLSDGEVAENLEAARFHIDLLDLLRQRTAGNLSAQERTALEDLLYRARMRYVQKRG